MDTKQLNDALDRLYGEGHRIVFWNDPEREFVNTLPFIMLDAVEVLRLDQTGGLEAKLRLEQDTTSRFLVYSPAEEPDFDDDWLLDVRLYNRSFRADRASIILDQLGLSSLQLRQHIAARRKFFDNKDRVASLKKLVAVDDNAADLDRKMLAVITRAEQPELFNLVRTVFHAFTDEAELNLQSPPPVWEQVEKFELDEPFWLMVKTAFGYCEEAPTLANFLVRLFVTDYAQRLGYLPTPLLHLQLPPAGRSNAVVCLAQWRDSASRAVSYDVLSAEVAASVKIADYLHESEIERLLNVPTFLDVEKAICRGLRDRVRATADTMNADAIREIATQRQAGHWVSSHVQGAATVPRSALRAVYNALIAAADFFALRNLHRDGFQFDSGPAMYSAYERELFRFDQLYRQFCEAADEAEAQNWDVLKGLREEIENCYVHWYLVQLSLSWNRFIDAGLLAKWELESVPNQQRFYSRHVQRRLDEAENRKAFVIVSDALRYEAAEELMRELNGKYRFQAELSSQLGVLPSYTRLGMASLLPHKTLAYRVNGDVFVDGKATASLEQRSSILDAVEGIAVRAGDLLAMKKEQGRELVSRKKVVYIYHDRIDAVGDDAKTESQTFHAVRAAIGDVCDLVRFVINNLNANFVVVTADHGFLFAETFPGETDKSKLPVNPPGTVEAKKRFLIGHKLGRSDEVWHGTTANTAKAEGDMEFWIPKGANRFHFVGGSRFIHGGAMLQEIVVPMVTVRHRKSGKSAEETKTKKVTVRFLDANVKITTPKYRFELLQMEPVSERVKPATLKVAVFEAEEPVTNIETVTFDSPSSNLDERKKSVVLVLRDRQYNKKNKYRLVLRDAETDIEQQSVDVIIDRAFTDDF